MSVYILFLPLLGAFITYLSRLAVPRKPDDDHVGRTWFMPGHDLDSLQMGITCPMFLGDHDG